MKILKWFILLSLLAPFVICDPYSILVNFKIQFDGGNWIEATSQTDATGTYLHHDLSSISEGSHTIKAKAYNDWGESGESLPFVFNKVIPAAPGSLKIEFK